MMAVWPSLKFPAFSCADRMLATCFGHDSAGGDRTALAPRERGGGSGETSAENSPNRGMNPPPRYSITIHSCAPEEAGLVLGHEGTGTCAEHGDLLLDLLYVVFAGLKINLLIVRSRSVPWAGPRQLVGSGLAIGASGSHTYMLDGYDLPGGFLDCLVYDAEAATCGDSQ